MWCPKCHYGSEAYEVELPNCPQCGTEMNEPLTKNPFPDRPLGMGSGKPKKKVVKKPVVPAEVPAETAVTT